ncbi:unnamed protein product [Albugo candida]|uniref:Uncharacterized protein n=1 Tax=Albugo candida TaxID=65357 RepID=A0A024GSV0_9STRA|nr:unnamed protein product [Albugo candida]|eukprot:CCI49868.1 unnamed protein product [Albugo candida]
MELFTIGAFKPACFSIILTDYFSAEESLFSLRVRTDSSRYLTQLSSINDSQNGNIRFFGLRRCVSQIKQIGGCGFDPVMRLDITFLKKRRITYISKVPQMSDETRAFVPGSERMVRYVVILIYDCIVPVSYK